MSFAHDLVLYQFLIVSVLLIRRKRVVVSSPLAGDCLVNICFSLAQMCSCLMHAILSFSLLIYEIIRRQLHKITYFFQIFLEQLEHFCTLVPLCKFTFSFLIIHQYFLNHSSIFTEQICFLCTARRHEAQARF